MGEGERFIEESRQLNMSIGVTPTVELRYDRQAVVSAFHEVDQGVDEESKSGDYSACRLVSRQLVRLGPCYSYGGTDKLLRSCSVRSISG